WQVFNSAASRPFRETNYEPEAMLVFRTGWSLGGWRGRMLGLGINHESNGRGDPYSRSWNRVVGMVGLDREDWALTVRPWWRISESGEDDNPGIENYIGRADATLVHVRDGHEFSLMTRHSLRSGEDSRGALRFTWAFPISGTLRGHLQVFDGYGESLIDYNHRTTHIGLGVSLLEGFWGARKAHPVGGWWRHPGAGELHLAGGRGVGPRQRGQAGPCRQLRPAGWHVHRCTGGLRARPGMVTGDAGAALPRAAGGDLPRPPGQAVVACPALLPPWSLGPALRRPGARSRAARGIR